MAERDTNNHNLEEQSVTQPLPKGGLSKGEQIHNRKELSKAKSLPELEQKIVRNRVSVSRLQAMSAEKLRKKALAAESERRKQAEIDRQKFISQRVEERAQNLKNRWLELTEKKDSEGFGDTLEAVSDNLELQWLDVRFAPQEDKAAKLKAVTGFFMSELGRINPTVLDQLDTVISNDPKGKEVTLGTQIRDKVFTPQEFVDLKRSLSGW